VSVRVGLPTDSSREHKQTILICCSFASNQLTSPRRIKNRYRLKSYSLGHD